MLLATFGLLAIVPMLCAQAEVSPVEDGGSTNGLYATAQFTPFWPGGGNVVRVFLHIRPPGTNIPAISPFPMTSNTNGLVSDPITSGLYFLATNSFCGFIKLRDASGQDVGLLRPEVNLPEAYPQSYNLYSASRFLERKFGPAPSLPLCLCGTDSELVTFHLTKYFNIQDSGDYQLSVWPKIYKRSETNHDIVKRIDLPTVTIPIKWK